MPRRPAMITQADIARALRLLSALRGMIRWMIDEAHLDEDDDSTIGLKSGKAKASRESGGSCPGATRTWRSFGQSGRSDVRHSTLHLPASW